jgi:hypothetical protein
MERGNEHQDAENTDIGSTGGGSATNDYGGMGRNLDQVDLDAANEVGADPPGGLPLDISGGRQGLDEAENEP